MELSSNMSSGKYVTSERDSMRAWPCVGGIDMGGGVRAVNHPSSTVFPGPARKASRR